MAAEQSLVRIFEYALNQEQTGRDFFQSAVGRMGIGAAVSAFHRLIQEEEKHIVFISKILDNLRKGEAFEPSDLETVILKPVDYFDERARSEFLQQCLEGSMVPDVTVFNTAWLIEKDISEFYARAAMQTSGKARGALQMLADWEKQHERFFREFRDKVSEAYASMPWGG
jgi:rubrerythrin